MSTPFLALILQYASIGVLLFVLHTPEAIIAPGNRAPSLFVQSIWASGQWVSILFAWSM